MKQVVAIVLVAAMLFALLPNGAVAFANESEGLESVERVSQDKSTQDESTEVESSQDQSMESVVTETGSSDSIATEDAVVTETEEASSASSENMEDAAHSTIVPQGTDNAEAQSQSFVVTFDTNESLFFEVSSVEVKAGDKVVEPTNLPLKRGYKFLYWSKNGEKYDFVQPVNESFALRAEFQELEQKDGHGFEVYVVDANTGEKMRLATEVKMLELVNDNSQHFLMKRATFAVTPTVAEIEAALNGKKYLEIKEANITALGHFWGRTKDVEPNPLKVWNKRKTPATAANPGVYFDVRYADDADAKYYGQIEGGVIEIVVNTVPDNQRVVSFDAGDAMQFEPGIVTVETGSVVKEPVRKPFKKGYKFLYWSHGGAEYDFHQPVNEHLELKAEFQELEKKNGNGFEVYVMDAVTKERVKVQSSVDLTRVDNEFSGIAFKRYYYSVNPSMEDIIFGIKGRKYLGIKGYNVTPSGHIATIGTNYNNWVKLEARKEFEHIIGHVAGSYGFSVLVAHSDSTTMNGPHYGQVEGGKIEIVVETGDNEAHLVQLELDGGVLFDKKHTAFYVDHGKGFAKPIEEPLKRGYRFLGWFNGTEEYDFDQPVTAPLTLTAKYEEISNLGQVKVQFELPNGAIVPLSAYVMVHEESEIKGMPILVHTYRMKLSNEQIQNVIGEGWLLGQIKEHKVEMRGRSGLNKGVATPIRLFTNERKTDGSQTELEFTIWTAKEKAQIEGGIVTLVLEADVTQTFEVTLDPNGGTWNGSAEKEVRIERVHEGMVAPNNPTKPGYRFVEWRKNGVAYNFDAPVTESFVLIAYYEEVKKPKIQDNREQGKSDATRDVNQETDTATDYFFGKTGETVVIGEEETPLSKADEKKVVQINGKDSAILMSPDDVIVLKKEDLNEAGEVGIWMSFPIENGEEKRVVYRSEGKSAEAVVDAVYRDGRMYVVVPGPGRFRVKDATTMFPNVSDNHWAKQSIERMGARKLMQGNELGDFMPDMPTSRAMMTQILARLAQADLGAVKTNHYDDVQMDQWYAASVNWSTDMGIVKGIGADKFAPETSITREELAVMIYNFARYSKWNLVKKVEVAPFADFEAVSKWAKEAVEALQGCGIFEGKADQLFDPKANVTRAEVATVIARLLATYVESLIK